MENDDNEEYDFVIDCLGISSDLRCVHNAFHIIIMLYIGSIPLLMYSDCSGLLLSLF